MPTPQQDAALQTILSKMKAAELPQLRWKGGSKPSVLEQWTLSMEMEIGGLHFQLKRFWNRAVKVVKDAHYAYLSKPPLQRGEVRPLQPDSLVFDISESIIFDCIEARLRSLLLNIIPETSKTKCLATKQLSTTDILFVVFVEAGPGTMHDKDVVLEKVSKGTTASVTGCWKELNDWQFAYNRLIELGVSPPDASVQLRAINKISSKLVEHNKEIEHRYYSFLVSAGISGGLVTQSQIDTLWK